MQYLCLRCNLAVSGCILRYVLFTHAKPRADNDELASYGALEIEERYMRSQPGEDWIGSHVGGPYSA